MTRVLAYASASAAFYVLIVLLILATGAEAHEATGINGQPLGWNWDAGCCGSSDCSIIPDSAVVEGPDGYHVTLRAGQHPMLREKGYSAIIPYGSERTSPTGEYGICLAAEGTHRFCFYAGGRSW
jgi:hypothetical protein